MSNKAVINLTTGLEDPACTRRSSTARAFIAGAEMGGTVPLWNWIGDEAATTFGF